MFCEQCGMELTEGTLFCTNCGTKVPLDGAEYGDDDKTVILNEEQSDVVETPDLAQTEGDPAGSVESVEAAEPVEMAAPVEAVEQTEAVEDAESAESSEAAEPVETVESDEPVGTAEEAESVEEAERVETVEISPTGVVGTGTAVAIPEAVEQKKFCPNCGAANGVNDLFCQQCGMFFGNAGDGPAPVKDNKKKKALKIAAAAVAAVAVIGLGALVVPRILGGLTAKDSNVDFVMYLKDNELTMARKNKYEPLVVGDRVFDDSDDASVNSYIDDIIQYSSDHQYVYYPQKIDDDGYDLYQKKLGSKKADEIKIDSGIVEYEVLDNDRLVYIKDGMDRKLYLYQKGESQKIASNVWNMYVSGDGKYLMWRDDNDRLYVQDTALKSDKVKLESDVSMVYAVSDNFNTIVYQKDDKLYVMKGMEEKEKIASDTYFAYVYDINGSLKLYYLKEGDQESFSYYDLIEDDCLIQDQQMAEPRIEDYQKVTYKDSFWGMQESVEVSDSYYEELEKYQQKQQRDYLRTNLENDSLALEECVIYYYEEATGESDKILTALRQQGGDMICRSVAENSALMCVYNIDREKVEGPKLSTLADTGYYEIQQEITKQLGQGRQLLYIENGEIHEIEDYEAANDSLGRIPGIQGNEDKQIFYIIDYDDEDTRLYSYHYGQKDASLELITDELMRVVSYNMDEICYYNADNELYYGDTMIAEDCAGISKVCENGAILYLTDMDKSGEEGTLHLYRNGKDIEIADDVAPIGGYGMFDSDKVVFLTDYSFKKYRGDLNVYDGKDVKTIDSDVTRIICE